jgi:hypothetical protein
VIHDPDSGTHLLFFAVSEELSDRGKLEDLGVAIVHFENCTAVRFGYPNDEGRQEHPFHERGWADSPDPLMEVTNSSWVNELETMQRGSLDRIWGGRGFDTSDTSRFPAVTWHHYLFGLKEITFEAIATGHRVTYADDWASAVRAVLGAAA